MRCRKAAANECRSFHFIVGAGVSLVVLAVVMLHCVDSWFVLIMLETDVKWCWLNSYVPVNPFWSHDYRLLRTMHIGWMDERTNTFKKSNLLSSVRLLPHYRLWHRDHPSFLRVILLIFVFLFAVWPSLSICLLTRYDINWLITHHSCKIIIIIFCSDRFFALLAPPLHSMGIAKKINRFTIPCKLIWMHVDLVIKGFELTH